MGTGKTTRKYQFKVPTFGNKICAPKLITAVFEKHRGVRDCDVKFFATPPAPIPLPDGEHHELEVYVDEKLRKFLSAYVEKS